MERQKVSEIARKLGVSCQSVYKKLARGDTRLTPHVFKEGKATFLDEEGFSILSEMFEKAVSAPVSPVDNQVDDLVTTIKDQLREKQGVIDAQQRTIENLISQQEESRKRTDTILMKLTNDISTLQKQLEYNKPEPIREESKKESLTPSVSQDRAADPRRVVLPLVEKRPPVQRELSLWESVQLSVNDVTGFLFGRG